jgi:hypothetical protein
MEMPNSIAHVMFQLLLESVMPKFLHYLAIYYVFEFAIAISTSK